MPAASPYETVDTSRVFTEKAGELSPYGEQYLYEREILIYAGSPEGNVSAKPTTLCMDSTGSAGNILYIKQSGTGNTGWILV